MNDAHFQNLGWGRRKNLRRHFGYPAQMHFEEGVPSRACVIIDMSETGAQLQVAADAEVPIEFSLLIGGNSHVRRQCRLVWRSRNRIGVQFRVGVKDASAQTARRPVQPA